MNFLITIGFKAFLFIATLTHREPSAPRKEKKMLVYTLRSEDTGALFTFEATVENIVREVKFMVECGFVLDGVDGLNGYKTPKPGARFAHILGEK